MDLDLPRFVVDVLRPFAMRGVIPDRYWWRLRVDGQFEVELEGRRFQYLARPVDVIGRSLFWKGLGAWEWTVFREFVPRARHARGFLDIGANTGVFSLVAATANPVVRVLAFEPSPEPLAILRENVRLNGLEGRLTVSPVAVSDRTGTARFFVPDGHPDMSFLEGVQSPRMPGRWHEVSTIVGEDLAPSDFEVDLVKIDVENAEGQVVRALEPLIEAHRPTIFVEMLESGTHQQVRAVLQGLNYRIGLITRDGVDWSTSSPLRGDPNNFLCEPISGMRSPGRAQQVQRVRPSLSS